MAKLYSVKAGVELDAAAVLFVSNVANSFHAATNKGIVVTSAYRGPREQAAAMYIKMNGPEWNIYSETEALFEIRAACLKGKAAKQDRATIISSMASVIGRQIGKGMYVSKHLRSTALDFRTRDLSAAELHYLKRACRDNGAKIVIDEGSPPHLHVQF